MKHVRLLLLAAVLLSGCDGNPFVEDTGTDTGGGTDGGGTDTGGITTEGGLPPGTTSPTAATGIKRYEPKGTDTSNGNSGNGFVTNVQYDAAGDTFKVDNLAFDGNNAYVRGVKVGSLGTTAVYEGKPSVPDSFSGQPVDQFEHRALYGVGADGTVQYAIVRTGGYVGYGFGGFIYQRSGGVTLPAEGVGTGSPDNPGYRGQAHYSGTTAGLRDFKGRGGLEYATADMTMDIDFDDFNDGNGVKGEIYNRRVFDMDGNDITQDIVDALIAKSKTNQDGLPVIAFSVGPGVMNDNGEIVGLLSSSYYTGAGTLESFDEGKYYALVSGSNAENVVGVFVVESADPRWSGVTARETGGFILDR